MSGALRTLPPSYREPLRSGVAGILLACALMGVSGKAQRSDPTRRADPKHFSWGWTLETQWGRSGYRECVLNVWTFQGKGQAQLRCTPNVPSPKDIAASRELSEEEINTIRKLAEDSDLYGGGHIGANLTGQDLWYETLTVGCCGRDTNVVLITSFNDTFGAGGSPPRREFLQLLHRWREELRKVALANRNK